MLDMFCLMLLYMQQQSWLVDQECKQKTYIKAKHIYEKCIPVNDTSGNRLSLESRLMSGLHSSHQPLVTG